MSTHRKTKRNFEGSPIKANIKRSRTETAGGNLEYSTTAAEAYLESMAGKHETESVLAGLEYIINEHHSLVDDLDDLRFMGFSALAFRQKLSSLANEKGISQADHTKNMSLLCGLAANRGTKVVKMRGKSDLDKWGSKVTPLIVTYGIVENVNNKPDAVTLGRLCAAYPEYVANALLMLPRKYPQISGELQNELRFAGAAALIPKSESSLIQRHKDFCIELDGIINSKNPTPRDRILGFWEAASNSPILSDIQRAEVLRMLSSKKLKMLKTASAVSIPGTSAH